MTPCGVPYVLTLLSSLLPNGLSLLSWLLQCFSVLSLLGILKKLSFLFLLFLADFVRWGVLKFASEN